MWLATCLMAAAGAEAPEAQVEVVVHEDAFARWDDTRWQIDAELLTPLGTWLAPDTNQGLMSYAFQVHAVIACARDAPITKKRIEVRCLVEDLSLEATSVHFAWTEQSQQAAQVILDQVDAMLTGVSVQLQVDAKGGVPHVDIEGLSADNERERLAIEGLRQVVYRMMSGYHLRLPSDGLQEGQFVERHSALLAVPSLRGVVGSTEWLHTVSPWRGYDLVQSIGHGLVTASVYAPRRARLRSREGNSDSEDKGLVNDGERSQSGDASSAGLKRPTLADSLGPPTPKGVGSGAAPPEFFVPLPMAPNNDGHELGVDLMYELTGSSVALFDRSSGILTERVWTVDGEPTASSLGSGGVQTIAFRNAGRLRLLGPQEMPDLGPTRQVAPPGWDIDGLTSWVPLETHAPAAAAP